MEYVLKVVFRGDLTDISASTKSLVCSIHALVMSISTIAPNVIRSHIQQCVNN